MGQKYTTLAISCFFLLFGFSVSARQILPDKPYLSGADTSVLSRINIALKRYVANSNEKIYLDFNRPNYNPGDTIWFKAYNLPGTGQSSAQSGVLYTELINEQDSVLIRVNSRLSPVVSWGQLPLSPDLPPGSYRIRAYTRSMLNGAAERFFDKQIKIGVEAAPKVKNQPPAYALFYPEGGILINGRRTKIAVRMLNAYGLGEKVTGVIKDDKDVEQATFTTGVGGIGVFALTPGPGRTYRAIVNPVGEIKPVFKLPGARGDGFSLAINNQLNDSVYVKIAVPDAPKQNQSAFYLIAIANGTICYTASGVIGNNVFSAKIAKTALPSGIVQFTVFSADGKVLNNRLIFNKVTDTLSLHMGNNQPHSLEIAASARNNKGVQGSFSVAVMRQPSAELADANEDDIKTYLQLDAELERPIEQPAYYFDEANITANADLDMLLVTEESKTFTWSKILAANTEQKVYAPEEDLSLEGLVRDTKGNPLPKAKVYAYCITQGFAKDTLTDANGRFIFKGMDLADTATVIVKAQSKITRHFNIYIKDVQYAKVSPAYKETIYAPARAVGSIPADISSGASPSKFQKINNSQPSTQMAKSNTALKEVEIKDKKAVREDISNNYGASNPYTIKGSAFKDLGPSLMDGLAVKLPFVVLRNGVFSDLKFPGNNPPSLPVVLNNRQIPRDQIDSFVSPDEVEDVKILHGFMYKTMYGVVHEQGFIDAEDMILITTKKYAGTEVNTPVALKKVTLAIDTSKKLAGAKALKEVQIKAKKAVREDMSNNYGASNPYTIKGSALKELGPSFRTALMVKIPFATLRYDIYGVSYFQSLSPLPENPLVYPRLHIVIDNQELPHSIDVDSFVSPEDVEDVKILHGEQYKTLYGIPVDPSRDNLDDIILITTKKFAGTEVKDKVVLKKVTLTTDTSKISTGIAASKGKVLKQVDIKSKKALREDMSNNYGASDPYNIKGSALKDLGPFLRVALASKLPFATLAYDPKNLVSFFQSLSPIPGSRMALHARLHVVLNNQVIDSLLDMDSFVSPEDVEDVKILHGEQYKMLYGIPVDPGKGNVDDIILITTKRFAGTEVNDPIKLKKALAVDDATYSTTPGPMPIMNFRFAGYSSPLGFKPPHDMQLAYDASKTVYWQPNLVTGTDGKASINLTGLIKGVYSVVVEGIDANGRIGRTVYKYTVE